MSNQVKQIIRQTVSEMLADSMSAQNIRRMAKKHAEKVHFVPIRYRISADKFMNINRKFAFREFALIPDPPPAGGREFTPLSHWERAGVMKFRAKG